MCIANVWQCYRLGCDKFVNEQAEVCADGHHQGRINVRKAWRERAELENRYRIACDRISESGSKENLSEFIDEVKNKSVAVANFNPAAADNILRNRKYLNYYSRSYQGVAPPNESLEGIRRMVDNRVFGRYFDFMFFFALTLKGEIALKSYGSVSFIIKDDNFLELNASLLEENSFFFFDKHKLGSRDSMLPVGYQSVWRDRAMLAVAKCESLFTPVLKKSEFCTMLLSSNGDREHDCYIEIVVYGESGQLDISKFGRVQLGERLVTREAQEAWERVKAAARSLHIQVFEFGIEA